MKEISHRSILWGFLLGFIIFLLPARWTNSIEMLLVSPLGILAPLIFPSTHEGKTFGSSPEDRIKQLENQVVQLEAELEILRQEKQELVKKLQEIADFTQTQPQASRLKEFYTLIVADIIFHHDVTSWRKSILISRGNSSGIKPGMAVIYGKYLVGKVLEVGPYTSRVQLISDPHFRVKGWVKPPIPPDITSSSAESLKEIPSASGALGVVQGYGGNRCLMKWVSREIPVKPGWRVFSAPDLKGIFPGGLIIGEVTHVVEEGHLLQLKIKPILDPASLADVIILKKRSPKDED